MQLNQKNKRTFGAKPQGNDGKSNSNNAKDSQCWECQGIGHFAFECANNLHKQRKAHKATQQTLSDEESNTEDESDSQDEQFIAFVGSLEQTPSEEVQNVQSDAFNSDTSDEEGGEDYDLQKAYDELCFKFIKVKKSNITLKSKIKDYDQKLIAHNKCEDIIKKLNTENEALLTKLSENESEKDALMSKIEKLQETVTSLGEQNEQLKSQNTLIKSELEKAKFVKVDLENRSIQLDKILSGPVRFPKDKSGLGYDKNAPSTSNGPPVMVKAQTPPQPIQKAKTFIDRTPKAYVKAKANPKVVNQNPKLTQRRFPQPYFCTYCRKEGHLRKYCYQLGNLRCASHEPRYNHPSNLEKHMEYLVLKVFERMLSPQKGYKNNHNPPNSPSVRQTERQRKFRTPTKLVWVPKGTIVPT